MIVNDGDIIHCSINGWIDGAIDVGDPWVPKQRNFNCFPCSGDCVGRPVSHWVTSNLDAS